MARGTKFTRSIIILTLVAAAGGGAWVTLHRGQESRANGYRTQAAERGDVTMTVTATGTSTTDSEQPS